MDFGLTKEQEMVRKMVREFAETELRPIAAEIDKTCEYPAETVKKMGKLGLMGMTVPKEYGGGGLDSVSNAIGVEEISRVCASHGVIMAVNNSLACYPIDKFGTEEQKKEFLVPIASGEKLGAFGLTEPAAGTAAASSPSPRNSSMAASGPSLSPRYGALAAPSRRAKRASGMREARSLAMSTAG